MQIHFYLVYIRAEFKFVVLFHVQMSFFLKEINLVEYVTVKAFSVADNMVSLRFLAHDLNNNMLQTETGF